MPDLPPVRVYAPVGTHEDLLPYLVRRLLENGANSSFVHQFLNPQLPVEQVVRDPIASLNDAEVAGAPRIREPQCALSAPERDNSAGADFGDPAALAALEARGARARRTQQLRREARSSSGRAVRDADVPVTSPADTRHVRRD